MLFLCENRCFCQDAPILEQKLAVAVVVPREAESSVHPLLNLLSMATGAVDPRDGC